jgi:hypothetical protein
VTRKADAKRAVIREWDSWAALNPEEAKIMDGMRFFQYLQQERSDFLDFRAVNQDKWQIVHGWLLSERRVDN